MTPGWRESIIIDNILSSGSHRGNHCFKWVPREANFAADWVAKASMNRSCPSNWVLRPPYQLAKILETDASRNTHEDYG